MINRLNNYRQLHHRDKIHFSAQYLADFNKSYQIATNAKNKLEDLYEKIGQIQSKPPTSSRLEHQNHQGENKHSDIDYSALLRPPAEVKSNAIIGGTSQSLQSNLRAGGASLADLQSKEQVYA
jgi:hypothetical protein